MISGSVTDAGTARVANAGRMSIGHEICPV